MAHQTLFIRLLWNRGQHNILIKRALMHVTHVENGWLGVGLPKGTLVGRPFASSQGWSPKIALCVCVARIVAASARAFAASPPEGARTRRGARRGPGHRRRGARWREPPALYDSGCHRVLCPRTPDAVHERSRAASWSGCRGGVRRAGVEQAGQVLAPLPAWAMSRLLRAEALLGKSLARWQLEPRAMAARGVRLCAGIVVPGLVGTTPLDTLFHAHSHDVLGRRCARSVGCPSHKDLRSLPRALAVAARRCDGARRAICSHMVAFRVCARARRGLRRCPRHGDSSRGRRRSARPGPWREPSRRSRVAGGRRARPRR